MNKFVLSAVVGLISFSAAHGASTNVVCQWQEAVFVNGSNCVVNGQQVHDTNGAEHTQYMFGNGARLSKTFEAQHQKHWNIAAMKQDGAPAPAAPRAATPLPVSVRDGMVRPSIGVALGNLDLTPVLREDLLQRSQGGMRARRIGVFRDLPAPVTVDQNSVWLPASDGGQVATVALDSPGAEGVRIAIDGAQIPADAQFMVYATDNPAERRGPYTRADLARSSSPRFWTESVWDHRVTLELSLPPGRSAGGVSFRVQRIVHTYAKLSSLPKSAAGACENDVTCQPDWANEAAAVAGLGNVGQDGFLFCTGCLLADGDPTDAQTFFMTANHCVGNQSQADTLEFYWFYQTATCNGTPPNVLTVPRSGGGADYLAGVTRFRGNDFTFLRLHQPPATGTFLAAWSSATPATGDTLTGIHHPNGDYKRISFSHLANPGTDPNFWNVTWFSGVTEPGSSGSPLFNPSHEFIGQLYGGNSQCSVPNGVDDYGRFDKSFPIIQQWLQPSASPVTMLFYPTKRDYDGDGKADLNVYHAPDATWYLYRSTQGFTSFQFGYPGTIQVVGDFDGDGKADPCVYDPATGAWYWFGSADQKLHQTQFGYAGTIPVPADYDGDGKTDLAVYDPATSQWFIYGSKSGFKKTTFGFAGVIPVPADYDGDGRADLAVYDPAVGNWYIVRSTAGFIQQQFGFAGVVPVPGDYDGDGKTDLGVYDPGTSRWYTYGSENGFSVRAFGGAGNIPVPGDYDGDGKTDLATYKLSSGTWAILRSSDGLAKSTAFGWSEAPPVGVHP